MIARRIIPGILALWLLTIILVTLNNTAYIRDILYDSPAAFTDYLCERQLAPYFTEGDPRYGVQYDNTSIYEYVIIIRKFKFIIYYWCFELQINNFCFFDFHYF